MISNNSQQFGMRGETLFIENASTSFSFFINYFSLKIAQENHKRRPVIHKNKETRSKTSKTCHMYIKPS
jgi:hypothetical protein